MVTAPVLTTVSDSRLANDAGRLIWGAFTEYWDEFCRITARAEPRFVGADWSGMDQDIAARLAEYGRGVDETAAALAELCGERLPTIALWTGIKAVYSGLISGSSLPELAETFFNSITRRVFTTEGVNQQVEFVASDFSHLSWNRSAGRLLVTHDVMDGLDRTMGRVLEEALPGARWARRSGDAGEVGRRIEGAIGSVRSIDVIRSVFYRGTGAYVIGRACTATARVPIAVALTHGPAGVAVDAVLTSEAELSILFSFARSYFHVRVDTPARLVGFLAELMPRKRLAELYMAIGFHKHGKTELFRDLVDHLAVSDDRFVVAPGAAGMVMEVFTLPGFEVVFKIIKDSFPPQKQVTPRGVRERYRLVFNHDRVGRLVDAYEFEYLTFPEERFDEALLARLAAHCRRDVDRRAGTVVLRHVYVERRVTPLDVYLQSADTPDACAAIHDYGQAIKDLAAAGIFPGDMLLKNFGVTRHGRVVFYDYDELRTLERCRFKALPITTHPDDELAAGPVASVGPDDVFPEEFPAYIGVTGAVRDAFVAAHDDLFTPQMWLATQQAVATGRRLPVYPYRDAARLDRAAGR
jgi:isocitrate dehydrogenase kinase/phosphatase